MYFPKQSIQVLTAQKGQFKVASTDQPYIGEYLATNDRRYFAGNNPAVPGPELRKIIPDSVPFGKTKNVKKYNLLKEEIFNRLRKTQTIFPSKESPTDNDYIKGYFIRYICVRTNDFDQIFEIDKETFDNATSKRKFDNNLYQFLEISWALKGNVRNANSSTLQQLARSTKVYQLINLFPILNEYEMPNQTDLYTDGGDLYYADGREYTGFYHIHPEKGPMEGAVHTENPHERLYYSPTSPELIDPGDIDISQMGYWKWADSATVYYRDSYGQDPTFSSPQIYFLHRKEKGFPEDFTLVKTKQPGTYYKYRDGDGTVYYEDSHTGQVISFSSPLEYNTHRETMGLPQNFSSIEDRISVENLPGDNGFVPLGHIEDEIL